MLGEVHSPRRNLYGPFLYSPFCCSGEYVYIIHFFLILSSVLYLFIFTGKII